MSKEIKAPTFPESVQDGSVATWHKNPGDAVKRDELLVEIETDKVTMEVVAPADGILANVVKKQGDTVLSNEVLATVETAAEAASGPSKKARGKSEYHENSSNSSAAKGKKIKLKAPTFPESVPEGTISAWHKNCGDTVHRDELIVEIETDKVVLEVVASADGVMSDILKKEGDTVLSGEEIGDIIEGAEGNSTPPNTQPKAEAQEPDDEAIASPSARKLAAEKGIILGSISGTGRNGLIIKEDVVKAADAPKMPTQSVPKAVAAVQSSQPLLVDGGLRVEKRVPMTRLRKRIAERLLHATSTTAMLTTFNEVNMGPVMELRRKYKDQFEKAHNGTRLGFMGFFVKASVEALKKFPAINASIDADDVVYHGYQDIGVAVSTEKGLVVPVLRNVENMGLADVEFTIRDFGLRARDGKLGIEDMIGGTFTITNGGVFGSLLSTPILNPPQTAILGMHKIQERPMAVNGQVVVQPMMYLALSYDHRLVDGKEAVQFLVAIKDLLEDPARILLAI